MVNAETAPHPSQLGTLYTPNNGERERERRRERGKEGERGRERERENVSRAGNVTFVSEQEVGAGSWTDEPDIKFSLKSRTIFL